MSPASLGICITASSIGTGNEDSMMPLGPTHLP